MNSQLICEILMMQNDPPIYGTHMSLPPLKLRHPILSLVHAFKHIVRIGENMYTKAVYNRRGVWKQAYIL